MEQHGAVWAALWVGGQMVFALIGYAQGRRDEEAWWRRYLGLGEKKTPWKTPPESRGGP